MRQVGATQTHSGQVPSGDWISLTGTITADRNLDAALRLKLFGVPTYAEIQVRASIDSAWHQANVPGEAGLSGGGTPVVVLAQADSLILYVPIGVVAAGEVVGAVILSSQTMPAEGQYVWELWDRSVMGALNTARPASPTANSPYADLKASAEGVLTAADIEAECGDALVAYASAITVNITSPVADDSDVTIYQGADYAGDQTLTFTTTSYTGYTPTSAVFRVLERGTYEHTDTATATVEIDAASVAVADSTLTITVDIAAADLDDLLPSPPKDTENYQYQIIGTTASDETFVAYAGNLTVKKMIGTPAA